MSRLLLTLFFLHTILISFGQIPTRPNAYDTDGSKTGDWIFYYDERWNVVENETEAAYYRLIAYEHGKPVGRFYEYFRSGQLQMEAEIFSVNPETYDGEVHWYSEEGNTVAIRFYKEGQLDYKESVLRLDAAIQEQKTVENRLDYAKLLSNLAILHYSQGQYAKAEPLYIEAVAIRKEFLGERHPYYASTLLHLATTYDYLEQYDKAMPLCKEVVGILREVHGDKHLHYAVAINNLASLYSKQGMFTKAEQLHQECLTIRKEVLGEKHPDYAGSLNNLAASYYEQGLYEKAEPLYVDALAIRKEVIGEKHPDYAISLNNLAVLYTKTGQYAKAEPLYLQAIEITKENFNERHWLLARWLDNLAILNHAQGNYEKAEPIYQEALSIYKEALGEKHSYHVSSFNNLSQLYHRIGKNEEAISMFLWSKKYYLDYLANMFAFMGEKEREKFYTTLLEYFATFQNFAIEESQQSPEILGELYNLQLANKSILLNTSNQIKRRILQSNDRVLIDLYNEVEELKQVIGQNRSLSTDEIKINTDSLSEILLEKDKQLSEYASFYRENQKLFTWQDVKAHLEKGQAAIELIRIKKWDFQRRKSTDTVYYAALIVTPKTKNQPELVLINNGNELENKYINGYGNAIHHKIKDPYSYQQFWEPLKHHLKGINTIYFSPDGVYNLINIESLYNTDKEKYLFEEVNVWPLTSTRELLKEPRVPMPNNFSIILGNPDFGEPAGQTIERNSTTFSIQRAGLRSLPGTAKEVDLINKLFEERGWRRQHWIEGEATEDKLKTMLKPKVLHIATHGFFEEDLDNITYQNNPLHRSGLLFAGAEKTLQNQENLYANIRSGKEDGILTAFEAMNLNIDNTELVVLSACETGLGEIRNGEGVYGLQRAFKVAGAKTILTSLWKVDDDVTQDLMVRFYKNWLAGMSKREAFKSAQTIIKKKYPHPYYWGAFVMVGE